MSFGKGTVFVLGAGFTKGFFPAAPLLLDDYNVQDLEGSPPAFPAAWPIVRAELNSRTDNKVNLERLMTRLSGRMPYDRQRGAEAELPLLLARIEELFLDRLFCATGVLSPDQSLLERFSRHCIRAETTCITFNYDEALDRVLWQVFPRRVSSGWWNPDRGYGFPCRPSETVLHTGLGLNGPTAMSLLKLHGSINWHATLGHPRPYEVSAIVHHAEWAMSDRPTSYIAEGQKISRASPVHRASGADEGRVSRTPRPQRPLVACFRGAGGGRPTRIHRLLATDDGCGRGLSVQGSVARRPHQHNGR